VRKITLIAAMDQNRVIGYQGRLPWRVKGELAHFKNSTMGKPLILGRKTFESLGGKTLPGREILVVSRNGLSLEEALEQTKSAPEVMIGGGAQIYEQCLSVATHMILSIIDGEYSGDTYFPEFDTQKWKLDQEEPRDGFKIQFWSRAA